MDFDLFLKKPSLLPAASIIPEEDILVKTPNGIEKRTANSYLQHFTFSFNRRYYFVFTWTWDGYKFFSTTALCLYLFQGPPDQVFLGFFVAGLEAVPQFFGMYSATSSTTLVLL